MRRAIWAGPIGLVLVSLSVWLALTAKQDADTLAQLQASAEGRWALRPFVSYRMVLEEGSCTADYEVRAERVVWGYETPCGRGQARSVANLFDLIGNSAERVSCEGLGCPCERVTTLEAHYDAELGYPTKIVVRSSLWPNWRGAAFWTQLVEKQANPCARSTMRVIMVKALIPHPG